jgi:Uma2 family endonuclease
MTSMPPATQPNPAAYYMPPGSWPNYDLIITDDGTPEESFYAEKQMRLLTAPLYASWPGPGDNRPFIVAANVGLFYSFREPPVVPDVMLSLDVVCEPHLKEHKSYFVWEYGKTPDAVLEIVSGTERDELGKKRRLYQKIGIPYYIVWDPDLHLSKQALHCFILQGRKYHDNGTWLPQIGLGLTPWEGELEGWNNTWLRWCDQNGKLIPTPEEKINEETQRADQEKQRAEQEKQRAEQEKQRAEKLAEKLRALGIDPDQP